ncbi:LytR/AlgR family response regulator transcription factor [Lacibacter sediminis]|uniref:Response regulator transcription factor n=1 Tax=Lacibacter sediminis TaxID=2760713 RepID=A0A7G5XH95_9BACT|nr:LytTR family DNA-binding domain-containing protein [Lacibacter sediminis]QNA44848.1 response regulator transcription factor [Lacibacter sediminis]
MNTKKIVIIEDEQLAAERLVILLKQYDPSIEIIKHLYSVEESIQWLSTNAHPDLLFLDIQLADGFCFDIFKQVNYSKPIIFTTAYHEYALDAFQLCSIDYLLKPVTAEALTKAMQKFIQLQSNFSVINYNQLSDFFDNASFKSRFLGKAGQRMFFVETSEVQFFQADDKIVYLVDKEGNKLTVDYTLDRLEGLLNPKEFFRLNRKYIARFSSIAQIKPYVNSRLKLLLRNGSKTEEVVLSRERVQEFKTWAEA